MGASQDRRNDFARSIDSDVKLPSPTLFLFTGLGSCPFALPDDREASAIDD
ncbi:MAG: hypothetical protein ACI87O_002671 [Planctomycetota bacterium]|jgi:hypothetical protein